MLVTYLFLSYVNSNFCQKAKRSYQKDISAVREARDSDAIPGEGKPFIVIVVIYVLALYMPRS